MANKRGGRREADRGIDPARSRSDSELFVKALRELERPPASLAFREGVPVRFVPVPVSSYASSPADM